MALNICLFVQLDGLVCFFRGNRGSMIPHALFVKSLV